MSSSDDELLTAWRAGDRRAGRELFDRHLRAVHRFFRNKLAEGVDDLVQQTFLACVEGQGRFRGEGSFRGWLFGIAHNIFRVHLRNRHGDPDLSATSVCDLGPSPSSAVAARAEQQLLLEALQRIPIELQIVLELRFWEDMTGPEIAQALDMPEGTVRTHIRRGRAALADQVERLAGSRARASSTIDGLDQWASSVRELLDGEDGQRPPS